MAKRKAIKTPSVAASRPTTPAEIRKTIERLDRDIVRQLNERARFYQRLAKLNQADGEPDDDPATEHDCLQQGLAANKGPLSEVCVRSILRELVSGSRALVHPLRVAYLGPPYSFSHLAAAERFGQSVELVAVATIAAVFEEVNRRHTEYGLVPIENSTDGRIVDTLEMFARLPVRICGEVPLRIHHCLLGKCTRSEVREVYSKPQALSQCRDWIAKHLPGARMVEMTSTAAAAKLAADKPGAAAVASREAGVRYGLDTIAANIEDNKNNLTRFAVIGSQSPVRTGKDKTSLMFEIPHQPGALADATSVFKRNRLNLTWIESFPLTGTENQYLFFVELEGHQNEMKVKRALTALEKKTVRLEVLGSYAKTDPRRMTEYAADLIAVRGAAARIAPFAHRTPVATCATLDRLCGRQLFFKCEHLQKVGAFKFRGACNAILKLGDEAASHGVLTHSSGNHAQALALAAKLRGIMAHVVMPTSASPVKRRAVEGYGARVVLCEPSLAARETTAAEVEAETGATFIPPYDHPDIIAGQGTAALELLEDVDRLDAIIAPVGGGGLVSGICAAAHGVNPAIRVFAAEPTGADDAARSKATGEWIPQTAPETIADGLLTSLGGLTWPFIRDRVERVITVTDEQIVKAMRLAWERAKLLIEPSAAAAVAAVIGEEFKSLTRMQRVGVVLSGGNVDLDNLPW